MSTVRQSDRNRLFDAVGLYPLVAVHTLDLGEYLQLQVRRRRATPGGDECWCARLVRCFQSAEGVNRV